MLLEGRRRSRIWKRFIVVAQTRYCNLGSRINNIISVLTLVSIFPLNFLYRRIFEEIHVTYC